MPNNNFAEGSSLIIRVVNVVDAAGNPATLPTVPVFSTSDSSILSLTASSDGLSASGELLKTGTVTVTATSGTLSASLAITGIAGAAVSFQLQADLAIGPV